MIARRMLAVLSIASLFATLPALATTVGATVKLTPVGNAATTLAGPTAVGAGTELSFSNITIDVDPDTQRLIIHVPTGNSSFDLVFAGGTLDAFTSITLDATHTTVTGFTPSGAFSGKTLTIRTNGSVSTGDIAFDFTSSATSAVPVVTASGGTTAFTEGANTTSTPVVIDSSITVTDSDSANMASATVSITGGFQNGEDVLAFINANGISGSYTAGTGVLALTGSSSLANYQSALRSITYTNSSDAPNTTNRTISFVVNDGTGNSTASTKTVSVSATNDFPGATGLPASRTFTEDTQAYFDISASAFNDPDSANITATLSASAGTFGLAASGSVTLAGNGTGTITVAGTVANVNQYLDTPSNTSYTPALNASGSPAATVGVTLNDGNGSGNVSVGTVNMIVTSANDAPTFTAGGTLSAIDEDTAAPAGATVTSLLNGNFSDVDSGDTFAGIAVTANAANNVTEGKWQYSTNGGTNWFDVSAVSTGSALLLSTATTLRFLPVANYSGTPGSLTVYAVDSTRSTFTSGSTRQTFDTTGDDATSAVAASGVALGTSITAVNDAPTLTATGANPTYAEGGSAVDLFGSVSASTVDGGQTFSALTLTVTNVADGANEILAISGTDVALANGNNVTLAGVGSAAVSVFGSTATVSITGMTRDNTQMGALVDGITYRNTATPPATAARIVTLTGIEDNGGTSNGGVDATTLSLASTVSLDLAPTITGRTVPSNGTYKTGQNLDFTVTYSENVTVNTGGGVPYIGLTLDTGGSVQAVYDAGASTATTLTFRYTVASGNADSNGVATATSITLSGATIRDGGNGNAPTTSLGFGATTAVLVDGVTPTVTSINRHTPSTASTNATSVVYRVTFSESVTGVDANDFTLMKTGVADGSIAALAAVSGAVYDVTVNAISGDGTLRLDLQGSGTGIADGATNAIATGYTSGQTYAIDSTAPGVISVGVPANATYVTGQNLDFTLNWYESVTVDTSGGTPTLALTIGSTGRTASYLSGSPGTALVFRYTVQAGDLDTDGITIGALALNGGTIRDTAGNVGTLTLNSAGATGNVRVDAAAPAVSGTTVPGDGTYKTGQNLDFTVSYSENVTVVTGGGTPYIALTLDTGGTVNALYTGGSSTATLTFRYTVATNNADANGIAAASSITLNGGTIKDAGGNDAPTTGLGFGATTAVLVDGVAPTVSSSNRHTPSTSSINATSVVYRVTFAETVTGVDATDFTLTKTGTADGSVASVAAVSGTVYDVTVNTITGAGTLRLDLKSSGTGIADSATNAIAAGYTSGETYAIDTGAPTLPAANIVVNNQADPHKVVLTFSEALDNTTLGAASAWPVTANGGTPAYNVASVGLTSGNVVTLTLAAVDIADDATRITNAAANAHLKVTPPATLKDAAGNAYSAGLVTEAGATHVLDTTAPTLSGVTVTAQNAISGTLAATASEKAKGYWIAVATGATAPNAAQVKAAATYGAVTIVASGNGVLPASASSLPLSNLLPVSDYDLYLVVDDAAGNSSSVVTPLAMWSPLTAAPTATTGAASGIATTGATLNGNVNDNGLATTVSFDYGTSTAYGSNAAATTGGTLAAGAGSTAGAVTLSGLACDTLYHFRIKAVNGSGTTHGTDATFTTGACAQSAAENPFNSGGTQTQINLEPSSGVQPTRAPSDIVTNLDKLDSRVGISDNGVVVVLDNGLKEPVKFRDNPPDNVLISMPSQKPLEVELNGNMLNIEIDPETPNPPKQTILSTKTLLLPDGTQSKGLQLVQGEVSIGNTQPDSALGGLELSKDSTLRDVVAQAGPEGGTAGFRKTLDGAGSISAEAGEVRIIVRLRSTGSSALRGVQAYALRSEAGSVSTLAVDETLILSLQAGEVARFNTQGELDGVFLGSLSGTAGKTGDAMPLVKPANVASYPAITVVFEGGNVPERIGELFSEYMNAKLAGTLVFSQRADGLLEATAGNATYLARLVRGLEVVPGAADGSAVNADGTVSMTFGGIRSTFQPMLHDIADLTAYLALSGNYLVDVLDSGVVEVSGGGSGKRFYAVRPRFGQFDAGPSAPRGLGTVATEPSSLAFTDSAGLRQQLDPAFHDEAQVRAAAMAAGWTLTHGPAGYYLLNASYAGGAARRVIPDLQVEVLDVDTGLRGLRQEGGKLYFYYADEPLRQGFTLK